MDDDRVPCPYDPKHTMSKKHAKSHMFRCNARPQPPPIYHTTHFNAPNVVLGLSRGLSRPYFELVTDAPAAEKLSLSLIEASELHATIAKVRTVMSKHYPSAIPVTVCQNKAMEEEIEEHRLKSENVTRMKHLQQQVSPDTRQSISWINHAHFI